MTSQSPLVLDIGAIIEKNDEPAPDLAWTQALAFDPAPFAEIAYFHRGRLRAASAISGQSALASDEAFEDLGAWLFDAAEAPKMTSRRSERSWSAPWPSRRPAVADQDLILLKPGLSGWDNADFASWLRSNPGRKAICLMEIPVALDWPEYSSKAEVDSLSGRLRAMSRLACACIVPDQTARRRLEAAFAELSTAPPPLSVIARPSPLAGGEDLDFDEKLAAVPYFIAIDAIESRANTTMLLHIWREFIATVKDAPKLVLAGTRGAQIEEIRPLLDWNAKIGRIVHEAPSLAPRHLRHLARHARAVLASDFTGASAPVLRDARALGAAIIASDAPAHREALGGGDLLSPIDGPSWRNAIRAVCAVSRKPQPVSRLIESRDVVDKIRALWARR